MATWTLARPPPAAVPPETDCGTRAMSWPVNLVPLVLAVVLLATPPPQRALADDSTQPVRVAGVIYLGDLPTVVADHEGSFADQGLDARVAFNRSGKFNLAQLRAGETDFALMALTPLVLDRLADETPGEPDDPVILASLVHSTQLNQVVGLASRGIERPADLHGRRVALSMGTNAEFVWWLFAHFHGFAPDAAELVDRPVERIPGALRAGEVDAAVTWEPWTSHLRRRFGQDLRAFRGSNVYTAKWVIVTTSQTATDHPDRARALLAAYREVIDAIARDPERAIRIYARRADVAPTILRQHWEALDHDLNLDWSIIAALQQQFDWARRAGHGTEETDILSLIETAPLRSVAPSAVGIPAPATAEETSP